MATEARPPPHLTTSHHPWILYEQNYGFSTVLTVSSFLWWLACHACCLDSLEQISNIIF